MPGKVTLLVAVVLTIGAAAYSAVLYPQLPERIPIHWNIRGEVDGYGSKATGLFLMPGVMVFLLGLWLVLPWLSPQNFKIEGFRQAWDWVWLMTSGLMAFCHLVIIQAGMHPTADLGRVMVSGLCAFFALIGVPLGKVKRNFWMGYRTPWTLANDKVWESCQHFASKTLIVTGLIGAAGVWLGVPIPVCIGLFLLGSLLPLPQSVIVYKRMESRGEL